MYPLNAILIGCDDHATPHIRRELMNCAAHLEAEFPGPDDAVDALRAAKAERRLLILEVRSADDLEALSRLTATLPGWPVVALVSGGLESVASHADGLISVVRAGASQIIALPLRPDDFKAALDRIALQFVYGARDTKVIAVAGATGGCGGTTLAINLAYEIAQRHQLHCILADLSLKIGMVATHLNLRPTYSILDLLRDVRRVDALLARRTLVKAAERLDVLAGPHELVAPSSAVPRDVTYVIDTIKQLADVVVLDVPCTYDNLYFEVLSSAGQVVLVGEQSLPSIRALKLVREALGRGSSTEQVVINRFDARNRQFAVDRLLRPLGVSGLLTVARDDHAAGQALAHGSPLRLAAPRSQTLADIVTLSETLLARDAPPAARALGLFGRLGRAFTNA